jgi:hypothetical protein
MANFAGKMMTDQWMGQTHILHYLIPRTWRVNQEHLACWCAKVDGEEKMAEIS